MGLKRNVLPFLEHKLGFAMVLAALCYLKPTAERKLDASEIPGFISIDCGAAEDYNDTSLGLLYRIDARFIDSGINHNISAQHIGNVDKRGINLRSFPNSQRNCYTIWPENATNNDYLIRAGFIYGNYDNRSHIPIFDLYIGIDKWNTVQLDNSSVYGYYEIIYTPTTGYVDICLVNTGLGVPFISFLELRPLGKGLYQTGFGSLSNADRFSFGASNLVRYPDDVYDRMWTPKVFPGWEPLSCAAPCKIKGDSDTYRLPKMVVGSAVQPLNDSSMYYYYKSGNVTKQYLLYLHFADITQHKNGEVRKLDVNINGEYNPTNVTIEYLKPKTIQSTLPISGATLGVWISASGDSNLRPILNALEIFQVTLLNSTPTALDDVVAMKNVKESFALASNWQGDPCLPSDYRWDGLDCTYDHTPRITSLNLSSSGLRARNIPASICKLAALKSLNLSNNNLSGQLPGPLAEMSSLEVLDLSNNKLSGQLPEFLAEISSLRVLNLSDNNFTGLVPKALREKWREGKLELSLAGNPGLPWSGNLKRKKSVAMVAASSTVALVVLIVISAILIFWTKKRKTTMKFHRPEISAETTTRGLLLPKGRQFSYSGLLRITGHFSTVIGGGGFGNVYYGNLDGGTHVAVKMLSQSSKQGYREFHAEAELLLMVHHRNLVSLLGYCIDGETMGLIYEYMANGNLQQHLSDRSANILQWHQRLQTAIDAAQGLQNKMSYLFSHFNDPFLAFINIKLNGDEGLEYLHNGCKPPIVHRDVKPSNILLDEKMQAKIADFGLSRAFGSETASHVSTGLAGTLGYLAPEVQSSGNFNQKTDVYSFGIVLLELITGRPALLKRPGGNVHILEWITPIIERGDIRHIVDTRLQGNFDHNSAWKAVEIAMSCVPSSAVERSDIRQIVTELNECLALHLITDEGTQSFTLDSEVPEAR